MLGTVKIGNQYLCEDVAIWIAETTSMPESWSGSFDPDPGANLSSEIQAVIAAAQTCRLHLDDGRSGDIVLSRITEAASVSVEFIGIGPLE